MTEQNPFTGNATYWWYKAKASFLEKFFAEHIKGDEQVLDIGSADGPAVKFIETRLTTGHKRAMDIVPDGLGLEDIVGSVEDIPLPDNSLDLVSAFDVIEHVKNEAKGLDEIYRVLKPGAYFFMSVPAYQWAWSKHDEHLHHYRRYTTNRAKVAVREVGFQDIETTYAFFGTFPIFALQRLITKQENTYAGETPKVSKAQERILLALCKIDEFLLTHGIHAPWGSSVLLKARKPE